VPTARTPVPTCVVGVGYTGSRLLAELENGIGVERDGMPAMESSFNIVYTVPPADGYLDSVLTRLDPPPARFVYISTTGVYGDRGGVLISESAERTPATERARRRVAAELRLERWSVQHGVELIVLRVPAIYGPERLGIDRLREKTPMVKEDDATPGNRIHVDDLVRCCLAALQGSTPAGIYNLGDGDSRSSTWFAGEVARQSGMPPPPTVTRAEAEETFSELRLSFLRESRRINLRKMRDVLGVIPRYLDASMGIAASLDKAAHGGRDAFRPK